MSSLLEATTLRQLAKGREKQSSMLDLQLMNFKQLRLNFCLFWQATGKLKSLFNTSKTLNLPLQVPVLLCLIWRKSCQLRLKSHQPQWWELLTSICQFKTARNKLRVFCVLSCTLKTWDQCQVRKSQTHYHSHKFKVVRRPTIKLSGNLRCGNALRWLSFWFIWSRRK